MAGESNLAWIPGDQLLSDHPALAGGPGSTRVLMVESRARSRHRPYHRKKLVLLLSAMRHFAVELRSRGFTVDYIESPDHATALRDRIRRHKPDRVLTMAGSEYSLRRFQSDKLPSLSRAPVTILPNTQFLSEIEDSESDRKSDKRLVMENFYRGMRRRFGILMEPDGQPVGGRWNFDADNRRPLPRGKVPPAPIAFKADAITVEVMRKVEAMEHAVGSSSGFDLAVTREDALRALEDFIENRLAEFGPYEDAMSVRSGTTYHSLLSAYVNIGLLRPMEMIEAAERAYRNGKAPINSVEGFIRQVLGWREFIYSQYWRQMPGLRTANGWNARRPMPRMFWDAKTEMNCIRHVAGRVIEDGYSHHIERLMIVCNFCLLAGIEPSQVADWFLGFYVDAFDWVVLPNVIGMGLNADGGRTATKPYIASANYIGKMSDYCDGCRYDRKKRTGDNACPFNFLYWNFLIENEKALRSNPRLGPAVLGLGRIESNERARIRAQARAFLEGLDYYEVP